jgi:hypothetical protein
MLNVWSLTSAIVMAVGDARPVSRMGRVAAARHLNQIVARCLAKQMAAWDLRRVAPGGRPL